MKTRQILPNWKIAVVGSGALGCYYGGRLANMGRDVHFLLRSDYEHVKKKGLRVKSKGGDFHLQGVKCYRDSAEIGPCDLVLVALKATSNDVLPDLVRPLLKEGTMILTLQNGLGNGELLSEHFGAENVLGGLCFVCINRTAPGEIDHMAQGLVTIGEESGYPQARTHDIASEFKRCGIVSYPVEKLDAERWKKLVWNIPFNGIAIAAGGLDTEQILADPALETLVRKTMQEVIAAAKKLGHDISPDTINTMIERTRGMGAYRPSSLIDFETGAAVEVEAIWGEPYRRAFNAGAEVGRMESLYRMIQSACARR